MELQRKQSELARCLSLVTVTDINFDREVTRVQVVKKAASRKTGEALLNAVIYMVSQLRFSLFVANTVFK